MDKNAVPRPPMGWNSYDYYDTGVTEDRVLANAAVEAEKLLRHGWEYAVVDIQWYARNPGARRAEYQYLPFGELSLDGFSRLIPDPERFPRSAGGAGFGPLAERVHALGLKFGIHIMRGIPRAAAHARMPVFGAGVTADEIADPMSVCRWNPDMYGVRDCPAGQAYYDSIISLYASWGVDFIKCDDICNTDNQTPGSPRGFEGAHEILMLRRAIEKCGRPMALSLSPGPALREKADFYGENANMWRITDDMWDRWDHLRNMFDRCHVWRGVGRAGAYPDCDMLPLGVIGGGFGDERRTRLTRDEQRSMMTLWCVFGSPLMLGAELTRLDAWTLSLLTNDKVLTLLDPSVDREEREYTDTRAVWTAVTPAGRRYTAVFNLSGEPMAAGVELDGAIDAWTGEPPVDIIPPHGCLLLEK